ncbi:hypothetical protein V1514DRAFT_334080 [Lipomyces japonicus]|uniref:uncharacterized protein n=1 Tax=Lipomyces japonicus TaxID=56871 RepID=UPI0034CF79D6
MSSSRASKEFSSQDQQARKIANLARVRENQRRCRARRKAYITELEEKIKQCQSQSSSCNEGADTDRDESGNNLVERENRMLRALLRLVGVEDGLQELVLRTDEGVLIRAEQTAQRSDSKLSANARHRDEYETEQCLQAPPSEDNVTTPSPLDSSFWNLPQEVFDHLQAFQVEQSINNFNNNSILVQPLPSPSFVPTVASPSACCPGFACGPDQTNQVSGNDNSHLQTKLENDVNRLKEILSIASQRTILCTEAYDLMRQFGHNRYDHNDLLVKLQCGEGPLDCQVSNKDLIKILVDMAEI